MFTSFLDHVRRYANVWTIGVTLLFCTLVATVLTFFNGNAWMNHVVSYSIGVTCMSVQMWVHKQRPPNWNREWVTVIAGISSLILGLLIGGTLGALDPLYFFQQDATGVVIGGVACCVAGFMILLIGHIRDLESERDAAQRNQLVNERELANAQLQTLQAQIEPHFLFNTLANVHSMIENDPEKASTLLDSLVQLLRISLTHSRSHSGTIGQEMELINHYLDVQQMRLGEKLAVEIEVSPTILPHALQPFLVQPLVENAIKHGIEPAAQGGQIRITANASENQIVVEIHNTLAGPCTLDASSSGMGIENVRKRLAQVYGDKASLSVGQSGDDQFFASLTIPFETVKT